LKDARDYKNILIFRIGHLGDTLVSLPAFWAIRKAFPEAKITLLTNVDTENSEYVVAKNVLPETGLIDAWMFYPKSSSKLKTVAAYAKLFAEIRRGKFDCLFYLMTRNRLESSIKRDEKFFSAAGIKCIFCTEFLRQNPIREPFEKPLPTVESEADFFLNCLPGDKFEFDLESKPDLALTNEEKEFPNRWLQENCEDIRKVAIAPGSKWTSKIWAEDNFAEVISKLIEKENIFPVIFGGNEDREKGNRLLKIWGKGANAAGELNIRQAAAALEKCALYLGNDTGTMHLAASVGTPCIAIFSAIDLIGRWNPYGAGHVIFRERVECEGCHSPVCKFANECLTNIKTEDVFDACLELLYKVRLI
jgi:ADP-heptose:LPS heptosyltransferase